MAVRDLAKRSLQRGLARNYGHQATIAALERAIQATSNRQAVATAPERFRDFIVRVKPDYAFNRWSELLIELLQQVADGSLKRLIVTVPPQHGKTELASRLFPAYYLTRFPNRYAGLTTYDGGISYGLSREARRYYKAAGGQMAPDSQNVGMWNTSSGGGLWAAGVGGAVTSRPAHLLVGDDWIKGQREADSPAVRKDVQTFYSPTWRSRLQKDGAIFLIGTRWHAMDLIGYVLKLEESNGRPEHWTVMDLPAIAEPANERIVYPSTCTVLRDWREIGEALCPERYELKDLLDLQASMQPRQWDAVYQCRPSAAEGSIFRRDWMNWYDASQPLPEFDRVVVSLDATFKDRATSDFCGFTVWGQQGRNFYLLDAVNERADFNRTLVLQQGLMERWRTGLGLVEDAANGPAIVSVLIQRFPGIVAVCPDGGKEARAFSTQPLFVQGRVHLPTHAPWLSMYLDQLMAFPAGDNDDLVDSTTQALRWLARIGPAQVTEVSFGYGAAAQQFDMAQVEAAGMGWPDAVIEDPDAYFPM